MPLSTISDRVAANVRAELARRQRSAVNLAKSLGWSQAALHRRMSCQVSFNVAELSQIADELGIPLSALIGEDAA